MVDATQTLRPGQIAPLLQVTDLHVRFGSK